MIFILLVRILTLCRFPLQVTPDEDKNIPLVEVDPDTKEPVQITGATLEDHLAGVDNR